MTLGFLLFAGGLALLYAGIKGQSIGDILSGAINPDNPPPDFNIPKSATDPGSTGGVSPGVGGTGGLVNPFRGAKVRKGRIDEGVDFVVNGPIRAMGAGKVTGIFHYSGFGTYIEYVLDTGKAIFVSEGITPHVRPGQRLHPGQIIATGHGGIETGFSDTGTHLPAAKPHYTEGAVTPEGQAFDALLKKIGVY